jgi:hypothetical protein
VQQSNAHPSTINQLLSRFQLTRQVSEHRRRRRQLKTAFRQDRRIVTTSRPNRLVSELHPTSGVWISDQSVKNMLLRDVSIRARILRVSIHVTERHCQRMLPGQPPVYTRLCGNGM